MSLINDLIPEVKELLEADAEKFPHLVNGIKNELSNNNMVQDLTVSTASTLIGYGEAAGVKFEFDSFVNKLYSIFGK
jgi:hypothetical protein